MTEREKFILPKHKNPTSPGRISSAAYNFVPLPDAVVRAVEDAEKELPDHDTYANELYPHTGYFDVKLTTKSPLYIRAPLTRTEFDFNEQDKDLHGIKVGDQTSYKDQVKNKSDFFYTRNPQQPVIPGSSLRGMLRNVLEIASYSKVKWVTDKRLFYRTVDATAVGRYYNQWMVQELGQTEVKPHPRARLFGSRVRGGFLRFCPDGSYIIEECVVARIELSAVLNALGLQWRDQMYELDGQNLRTKEDRSNPNQTPKWQYQCKELWVDVDANETPYFFPKAERNGRVRHRDLYLQFRRATNPATSPDSSKQKGQLVLTGHINYKHLQFMFVSVDSPQVFPVPNNPNEADQNLRLIDRFQDEDQITQWQTKAFPKDRPAGANRKQPGWLRDGEPVFFLTDDGGKGKNIIFFGRTQMFRMPYKNRPFDLVPPELRRPEDIDVAEALFGYVRTRQETDELINRGCRTLKQGSKSRAYASRIFVTDATVTNAPNGLWLSSSPRTPGILATPKPTSFQHYLTQQQPNDKRELDHYDSPPPHETVIRGHKLYWHQGDASIDDLSDSVPSATTQHTSFHPIKSDVSFKFRMYFENFSDEELGAMCWTLHPLGDAGKEYCHKLGMGKPFGMGAVKLEATLHLTKRDLRYRSLFDGAGWQTGSRAGDGEELKVRGNLEAYVSKFERKILGSLEPLEEPCQHLSDLKRIGMLLKMMEWNESPPAGRSRTPGLEEFKQRRVLPDPSHEDFASASLGSLTGYVEPKRETAPNHFSEAESDAPARVENRTATPIPPGKDRAATDNKSRAFYGSASTTAKAKKPKMSEDKEKVVLLTVPENGRAQVRTRDGKEISARFGTHLRVEVKARYRAIVRRQNGEPLGADVEKLI
jgi:CRISPR-associated protein (TIGR03986 family)